MRTVNVLRMPWERPGEVGLGPAPPGGRRANRCKGLGWDFNEKRSEGVSCLGPSLLQQVHPARAGGGGQGRGFKARMGSA